VSLKEAEAETAEYTSPLKVYQVSFLVFLFLNISSEVSLIIS
jgi:hypothetical protein